MKIIGHRGAKGLAPENTLASFQKALDHHVDEIECDAYVTADSIVVLAHDPYLHDPAGGQHKIADATYEQLLAIRPDLATLKDALALVNRQVPFMIEIKPGVPVEPILDQIRQLHAKGWQLHDITVASWGMDVLIAVHQQMPEITLSVIETWSGVRASWRARKVGATRLSMNQLWLWSGFVKPMQRRGYEISAYTVNSKRALKRMRRAGVQAIFTDFPDILES